MREGAASIICAVSGGEWRTIQKRRRAATSPGCRHAAGTPVARLRRSGKIRMAGPGGITRFAHPLPAARSCASRPLSVAAGRRRAEPVKFWRLRISGEGAGALEDAGLSDQ